MQIFIESGFLPTLRRLTYRAPPPGSSVRSANQPASSPNGGWINASFPGLDFLRFMPDLADVKIQPPVTTAVQSSRSLFARGCEFMDQDRTIEDFGKQWSLYRENPGYYGSVQLFRDIVEPLLPIEAFKGKRVAEIGSGSGRIVEMLMAAEAEHVVALEPSDAIDILRNNTKSHAGKITYVKMTGDQLPLEPPYDIVISIGVIHHILEPNVVIRRAYDGLVSGGRILIWLYGKEGNELYLRFARPLRRLTTKLPDFLLSSLSHLLASALVVYINACKIAPLPMRRYVLGVLSKYKYSSLWLTVFDQLNPNYAKYYTKEEAETLLRTANFTDVMLFHRHGYSWTVIGTKQ